MLEWTVLKCMQTSSYNECHGFDNKIGIINAYQLAVTFDKSLISTPSINEINMKEIDLYKSGID